MSSAATSDLTHFHLLSYQNPSMNNPAAMPPTSINNPAAIPPNSNTPKNAEQALNRADFHDIPTQQNILPPLNHRQNLSGSAPNAFAASYPKNSNSFSSNTSADEIPLANAVNLNYSLLHKSAHKQQQNPSPNPSSNSISTPAPNNVSDSISSVMLPPLQAAPFLYNLSSSFTNNANNGPATSSSASNSANTPAASSNSGSSFDNPSSNGNLNNLNPPLNLNLPLNFNALNLPLNMNAPLNLNNLNSGNALNGFSSLNNLNSALNNKSSTTSAANPGSNNTSNLPPLLKLSHENNSFLPINTSNPNSSNYHNYSSFLHNNFDSSLNYSSLANGHFGSHLDTSPSATLPLLKRTSSSLHSPLGLNPTPQLNSVSSETAKVVKHQPRKKRECPICHKYFSNLTTHKTIHNKDSKPFICSTCNRAFKRLNDLIRHEKCHLSQLGEWEFQCPFHSGQELVRSNRGEICHHSGYFTRCDTYKNHLKAIHFRYPPNTLKSDRLKVSGHCRECGAYFGNVQEWLTKHIETNQCPKMVNSIEKRKK